MTEEPYNEQQIDNGIRKYAMINADVIYDDSTSNDDLRKIIRELFLEFWGYERIYGDPHSDLHQPAHESWESEYDPLKPIDRSYHYLGFEIRMREIKEKLDQIKPNTPNLSLIHI